MVYLLLMLACQGPVGARGATGPQGAPGATGEQGPTGADGAAGADGRDGRDGSDGPHWVDDAGEDVTSGTSLIWFDASGNYWAVDPETGAVGAVDESFVYYASADCSGDGYVVGHAPREVFAVGGATVSRPPSMLIQALDYGSFLANDCNRADGVIARALQRSGLNGVWVDRAFVGPLALVP